MGSRSRVRDEELRLAAGDGDIARIEQLLLDGCDPSAADELGWTALHHAAKHERLQAAELLLQRGADVNAHEEGRIGETALGEVSANCSLAMARLLIAAGANPTISGWMKMTALDRTRNRKRGDGPAIHKLLVDAAQRWRPGIK